jgi:GTP cyclohydrolase II
MSFFSDPLLDIGRASGDLRRGVPINMDQYSISAVESLTEEGFVHFPSRVLAAPSCSNAKKRDAEKRVLFYDISELPLGEIISSISCGDFSKFTLITKSDFHEDSIEAALRVLKKSELLPFILVSQENIDGVVTLSSEEIDSQLAVVDNDLYKTAEASLNLKDAENAKIFSFRSRFIPQDHYAIVIGDISTVVAPAVRIHSSCFTGDLMASLSCDCRDQLLDAVKFMSQKEENAGIIIYLMQEGRGIGLANKIRAYNLQQQGCDTIEANNLLGFDDDERSFDSAYRILQSMNIEDIKLLTNNPAKAKSLEDKGIKISKTISLYGNINKYNKSYLATKKERMGHDL